MDFPSKSVKYETIGVCKGRGVLFSDDGSRGALSKVEKCACRHGGNAIVITETKDTGYDEPGVWRLKLGPPGKLYKATVIKIFN